jgi:ABC-type polysaccharide/polyol phosphate export permease
MKKVSKEKMFRLIYIMTCANLKSRYRNTIYGVLWVILYPVLIYAAQVFAFTMIFQLKDPNYPLYLLAGLVPWIFITQSVEMCTGSYLNWGSNLKNLPVPPIIIPFIQLLDNFINFFGAFYLLLIVYAVLGKVSFFVILVSLIPTLLLAVFVSSICTMFALFNLKYRDLKFVLSFLFTLLFYLTPIFYNIELVPDKFKWIVGNNPFYYMLRPFQELLLRGVTDSYLQFQVISFFMTLGSVIVFYFCWKKYNKNVVFYG